MLIRTRFAPSPTGYLHIGGARTAMFSYLFAKHHNGEFIVRFEDTDIIRNVENAEKKILEDLKWLGIDPDESIEKPNQKYGPYKQSEKLIKYQKYINILLQENLAYKAYDTEEELLIQKEEQLKKGFKSFRYDKNWLNISEKEKNKRNKEKKYCIRLSLKKNTTYKWNDLIRSEISFNSNDIGDWVIQKSNGYPTYNFAVVIDDWDMQITHIFRGEEHISNTPKQLSIYEAFDWNPPFFGHLTLITDIKGEKISKRSFDEMQYIKYFKENGYLPEAIFNYLVFLGWTAEGNNEIFSKEELINIFDVNRLSKSSSKFDVEKLNWYAKKYMQKLMDVDVIKHFGWKIKLICQKIYAKINGRRCY